jgi:hypothetical protein
MRKPQQLRSGEALPTRTAAVAESNGLFGEN